jgi:hypothetical protein
MPAARAAGIRSDTLLLLACASHEQPRSIFAGDLFRRRPPAVGSRHRPRK